MSQAIIRTATMTNRLELPPLPATSAPQTTTPTLADFPANLPIKWTWSCRELVPHRRYAVLPRGEQPPRAGDVVLVQVDKLGYHSKLTTTDQGRLRLYSGDALVTVIGNRYATDAYEARVESTEHLHLLTGAGMVGTVVSKNKKMKAPTHVDFLGYLADDQGQRLNLKQLQFRPKTLDRDVKNLVLLIGTGMNSGKTTTGTKLVKSLLDSGLRVANCKMTGSVSHNDLLEMRSTGAHDVRDFSDYGFPSTYLCEIDELVQLFETMLVDALRVEPDVIVMEIADGLLQRETEQLLRHPAIRGRVRGIVHTAACAASALYGVSRLQSSGHEVIAVSGLITSSPLFVRELTEQTDVTVCSSADNGFSLAQRVKQFCQIES